MKRKILIGALGGILLMQFIRPAKNEGELYADNHIRNVVRLPGDIDMIFKTSCYDCHSNLTHYPWYTNIQPIGWWMARHIDEGRDECNFSEFKSYKLKRQLKKFKQIAELVDEREMPLGSYTWIHRDAVLNDEQIGLIKQWAAQSSEQLIKDSLARNQQ